MASPDSRTRLIICVDGTWCSPDGADPGGRGNITNIYRIYASVKQGLCYDKTTGESINQVVKYYEGIGSADDAGSWDRTAAGAFGKGYKTYIRQVYQQCCQLDKDDEVWLYGFSRGAYIVRAVAGLLHWIGSLNKDENFDVNYKRALELLPNSVNRSRHGPGKIHSHFSTIAKLPPTIRFVGAFDTVKAVQDANLYDISYNDSIEHFRHALALNENRKAMLPEYVRPNYASTQITFPQRSLIEAWFVGAHIDVGGSAAKDGLALYPCQWMLLESEAKGLVLEFSKAYDKRAPLDNPLEIMLPSVHEGSEDGTLWSFKTRNEISVVMKDLGSVHKDSKSNGRYRIAINKKKALFWPKQLRSPFDANGVLKGYSDAGQFGTIVHPSVYHFIDVFPTLAAIENEMPDYANLERWRRLMLGQTDNGTDIAPWAPLELRHDPLLKSLRILVCGDAGVGKSTLINQVFGVADYEQVTSTSHRKPGEHNINEEIIHPGREDLILHDSKGFETGTEAQIQAVEDFFRDRGSCRSLQDRLHVIWLCIDTQSDRPLQTATKSLLKAKQEFVADVPIIVVATRKDRFEDMEYMQAMRRLTKTVRDPVMLHQECNSSKLEAMSTRLQQMEKEVTEAGTEPDACVGVAQDDTDSITNLSTMTLQSMNNEKVRALYIATQVASVDIKIDLAVANTIRANTQILKATFSLSSLPLAITGYRTTAATTICKQVLACFGVPNLDASKVQLLLRTKVWNHAYHTSTSGFFAEAFAVTGLGVCSTPFLLPATTRLMMVLAADLILVLARAFKDVAEVSNVQPQQRDVEIAATTYRLMAKAVHRDIMALIPRGAFTKLFSHSLVGVEFGKVIHKYKERILDAEFGRDLVSRQEDVVSDTSSDVSGMSELKEDLEAVTKGFKSMQV